jgi:hypothetical protein
VCSGLIILSLGLITVIHCTEILAACLGVLPKVAGHGQNRSKIDHLKGGIDGIDGFSYFSLIFSYYIFYPESSLV